MKNRIMLSNRAPRCELPVRDWSIFCLSQGLHEQGIPQGTAHQDANKQNAPTVCCICHTVGDAADGRGGKKSENATAPAKADAVHDGAFGFGSSYYQIADTPDEARSLQ